MTKMTPRENKWLEEYRRREAAKTVRMQRRALWFWGALFTTWAIFGLFAEPDKFTFTDSLLLMPSIGLRVSQLVAGIAVVGGVIAEILLTRKFRDKPLMVELPLNSENRARMKKLDDPTAFAGTDAALPASASRAEFVEKTAAWNETVKEELDRRERPEKNEKNPE